VLSSMGGDPASGQVLFATTVVDNGINILPPPGLLIDTGVSLNRYQRNGSRDTLMRNCYQLKMEPSTPAIATQRSGRVGRISRGVAVRLTGEFSKVDPLNVDWAHYLKYSKILPLLDTPAIVLTARIANPGEPIVEFLTGLTIAQKVQTLMAVVLVSSAGGLDPAVRNEGTALFLPVSELAQARKNAYSAACSALGYECVYPTQELNFSYLLSLVSLPVVRARRTIYVPNTYWRILDSFEITVV